MNVDEAHDDHSAAYSDPEEPQEPHPHQDPPDQGLAYRDTEKKGQQKTEQNGAPDADHLGQESRSGGQKNKVRGQKNKVGWLKK